MSFMNLAVAALPVIAHPAPVFDLELINLQITSVTQEVNRFEIGFSYTIANVGTRAYDPNGIFPGTDDNATIQTYLSDSMTPVFASGGYTISDAPVLNPGDQFTGSAFANTANLPNPLDFGDIQWLVVDLFNTGEEPENLSNNRATARIPAPATTALGSLGLLLARTRRR